MKKFTQISSKNFFTDNQLIKFNTQKTALIITVKAVKNNIFLYERLISLFSFAYLVSTKQQQDYNRQSTDADEQLLPPLEAVDLLNLGHLFGADNLNWYLHTVNLEQRVNSHLIIVVGIVVVIRNVVPPLNDSGVTFDVMVDTIPINHRITHLDRVTNDVNTHVLGVVFLRDHHWLLNILGHHLFLWLASVAQGYHKADADAYRKSEEQLTTAFNCCVVFHHLHDFNLNLLATFLGWHKVLVHQVEECLLRVNNPTDYFVVADYQATSRRVGRAATMNEDTLKVWHVEQPRQISVVLLGIWVFGEVAKLGGFDIECHGVCAVRDCRLALDFNLGWWVKPAVFVNVTHFVLHNITDINFIATLCYLIKVSYCVGAF